MRVCTGIVALLLFSAASVFAQSPVPVESVATVAELEMEVTYQVELLEKLLSQDGDHKERAPVLRQAFGVLACVGQGLVEHPEAKSSKVQGAALRDAALLFKRDSTHEDAMAALAAVKLAQAGTSEVAGKSEHAWNRLVNMHPMMEEMNARNAKIVKILARPRGKADEPVHATTLALLSIAMLADTHEVKNEGDIPQWNAWSNEYREHMLKVAHAIRMKQGKEGREAFDKANETCDACHEKFRD